MINLVTGVPGSGKTLMTIYLVKALAEKENRPVFYHGIADLRLPWTELQDPTLWHQCPPGSIVVLDECQRIFRPRSMGKETPAHVVALETHRHAGIDLWLITQNPMLVESNVRRLVGIHRHVNRTMGLNRAVIHEWSNTTVDRPDQPASRASSVKVHVAYPKEVFAYYKSAEVHTHKARIPFRIVVLVAAVIGAISLGTYGYLHGKHMADAKATKAAIHPGQKGDTARPVMTKAEYLASATPRIAGLPYTAPRYDEVLKPTRAPKPVAAVAMGKECRVYTQDGTRIPDAPRELCLSIVANGYFDDSPDKPSATELAKLDAKSRADAQVGLPLPSTPRALERVRDAQKVVDILGLPADDSAIHEAKAANGQPHRF